MPAVRVPSRPRSPQPRSPLALAGCGGGGEAAAAPPAPGGGRAGGRGSADHLHPPALRAVPVPARARRSSGSTSRWSTWSPTKLGVEQQIIDTPFDDIQSGAALDSGQCDLGAAAMTITEARKQNIDFSDPYFDATQALLVKEASGITGAGAARRQDGRRAEQHHRPGVRGDQHPAAPSSSSSRTSGCCSPRCRPARSTRASTTTVPLLDFAKKNPGLAVTDGVRHRRAVRVSASARATPRCCRRSTRPSPTRKPTAPTTGSTRSGSARPRPRADAPDGTHPSAARPGVARASSTGSPSRSCWSSRSPPTGRRSAAPSSTSRSRRACSPTSSRSPCGTPSSSPRWASSSRLRSAWSSR